MNFLDVITTKASNRLLVVWAIIAIFLMNGAALNPDMILYDRFHNGEFHANTMNYLSDVELKQQGLAIHGLLNILPGMITASIWGLDNHFIPTHAFIALLNAGASVLLVLIAIRLVSPHRKYLPLLVSLSIAASIFVSHKDFFLLLTLLQFLIIVQNKQETPALLQLFIFGCSAAFALFYSSDRGVAGTVSLGTATLFLAWFDRRFLISIAAFIGVTLILSFKFQVFSIPIYLRNIEYLIAVSPEWRYPWNPMTITQVCGAVIINLLSYIKLWECKDFSRKNLNNLAFPILLTILGLFMLKIGTNRADPQHIMNTLWVPFLIAMSLSPIKHRQISNWLLVLLAISFAIAAYVSLFYFNLISFKYAAIFVSIPALLLLVFFGLERQKILGITVVNALIFIQIITFSYYATTDILNKNYLWIGRIASPPPNSETTVKEVVWAANQITANNSQCIFDMSNNGLINGLAKLPTCSRFTYPIYAAPRYESLIIEDLIQTDPPLIIYSSSYWSYQIDGTSMTDRYPKLDKYLTEQFPVEQCEYSYCFRSVN